MFAPWPFRALATTLSPPLAEHWAQSSARCLCSLYGVEMRDYVHYSIYCRAPVKCDQCYWTLSIIIAVMAVKNVCYWQTWCTVLGGRCVWKRPLHLLHRIQTTKDTYFCRIKNRVRWKADKKTFRLHQYRTCMLSVDVMQNFRCWEQGFVFGNLSLLMISAI